MDGQSQTPPQDNTPTTPIINEPRGQSQIQKTVVAFVVLLFLLGIGIVGFYQFFGKHSPTELLAQSLSSTHTTISTTSQQTAGKVSYTQDQLQSSVGSTLDLTNLPLGDNKYTHDGSKVGYIYLCRVMGGRGGAQVDGIWIHGTTWNATEKIAVSGKIPWNNAQFSDTVNGNTRTLSGNGLPTYGTTGTFPISSTDLAYTYDRNPNSIKAQSYSLQLPVNPTYQDSPTCMGGEVGVMLNGVPLFNGFDAENRDAAAHESQDSCQGHPQESGQYHYHSLSSCMKDLHETSVIGFALDGFPITGPILPSGKYLTTNDLDECHGMTSKIILDNKPVTMYHYVMTEDFPYSVSCFRAKPVSLQVISRGDNPVPTGSSRQLGQPEDIRSSLRSQPPQQAILACDGKQIHDTCWFTVPDHTVIGTCQIPPNQSQIACLPNGRPDQQ